MQKRIFRNTFWVSFIAVILTSALLLVGLYSFLERNTLDDMKKETNFLASGINYYKFDDFKEASFFKNSQYRITIINNNGEVLYDNKANSLESHKNRPEFIQALEHGVGEEKRYSATLGRTTYYYAEKLNNDTIIRLAITKDSLFSGFLQIIPLMVGILILSGICSYILAVRTTRRIIKPIDEIIEDLDGNASLNNCDYEEFVPFVQKISSQRKRINEQIEKLKKDKDTIATITENMKEGLILLDKDESILALNKCAKEILKVKGDDFIGKNIITATRNELVNEVASKAIKGNYEEVILEQSGKIYQIHGCNVENQGDNIGTVLFFVDVTSEELAIKMRKEFTGNVSHELKTPLTSISGYAEMIKNGFVKSEDIEKIGGKIFKECSRMISLVNDILTLSKLDENLDEINCEKVEALSLALNVAESLREESEKAGVKIEVEGEKFELTTSVSMLSQLLSNLIENGIKYNNIGGSVIVTLCHEEGKGIIKIKDTGIGIPEEDRDRIFERFYRVEKSRSKDIAGTGLGLSIVKHIGNVLGGKIQLESEMDKGTIVTLEFTL